MKYSKLNNFHSRRRFNPQSTNDLQELKYFVENTTWKTGCPFYLEDPYSDIPSMCKDMFVQYVLKDIKVKSPK